MGKAKIGFEVDEQDLANAKAYVARHGGSLNRLVSALFASLGREETAQAPVLDPARRILVSASIGEISILEAAERLELPDAGHVLHRLAKEGLPLPRLPQDVVQQQLDNARQALDQCLLEPEPTRPARRTRRSAKA